MPTELPPNKQYELETLAEKKTLELYFWSLAFGPVAYAKIGEWGLATFCLLTCNWFLFGFVFVPLHIHEKIVDAEDELARAGVDGYERHPSVMEEIQKSFSE